MKHQVYNPFWKDLTLVLLVFFLLGTEISSASASQSSTSGLSHPAGANSLLLNSQTNPSPCRAGTGWTWSNGSLEPEIARQAESALSESGIGASVTAIEFGEKDSCGNFELFSIDFKISMRDISFNTLAKQNEFADQIKPILTKIANPQVGNVEITFGSNSKRTYNYSVNSVTPSPEERASRKASAPISKNVYLLVYDPILSNGQHFSTYMGWSSPLSLTIGIINLFLEASNNHVVYNLAKMTTVTDQWPIKLDGFRYNESTYLTAYQNGTLHLPNEVDYDAIIGDPRFDICGKLNRGEIDELWIYGGPYDGFYESRLVGPGGYWYNSSPMADTHGCNRLLPIMGLNFERGLPEAMHSFGHRAESALAEVYGGWQENNISHNWDRFALVDFLSPNFQYSGCGNIHFPPNGVVDYDYENPSTAFTYCDDFLNYPNLSNPLNVLQSVTCTKWNCDHLGYLMYWYSHLPSKAGCTADWISTDWWQYFADANLPLDPAAPCRALSSFGDVPFTYWSFDSIERLYSAGITGGCSTTSLSYCPESPVTRAQMAVFLEKSLHYPNTFSPPNVAPSFTDTVGHWAEDWIEVLRNNGITGGCGTNLYCPEDPVTRAQMAVFLLKSKYGSNYTPPAVGSSTGFTDVPASYWAAAWIKQLAAEGITGGCGTGTYCPESPVTRAQMAVFLVRTFNLP